MTDTEATAILDAIARERVRADETHTAGHSITLSTDEFDGLRDWLCASPSIATDKMLIQRIAVLRHPEVPDRWPQIQRPGMPPGYEWATLPTGRTPVRPTQTVMNLAPRPCHG